MRRAIFGMAILAGLSAFARESRAQTNFSDPFFLYYGYVLPRQQAIAATPTVNDTLNAVTAARQANASTNRANLYDPNGGFAPLDDFDGPGSGGGQARNDPRLGRIASGAFPSGNIAGTGPALYYNRTARYYPSIRSGRGPNRNLSVASPRRGLGGGGGAGMPSPRGSAGFGMPGPR